MKKIESPYSRGRMWSMALLLGAVALVTAGCGGGGGRDPILGADVATVILVAPPGAIVVAPPGAIAPSAVCPVGGPSVTASNPTNGNQLVTTSTSGVANGGKLITATFSEAMNAATINAATFKLAPTGGVALVPASVSYNANVATLTTSSALLANTAYTAVIQAPIANGTGTPIACSYIWTFKTATIAAAAPVPVNLGLASSFGIAATAGVTNTTTSPITHINGDVVLDPGATCNAVPVDGAGGFGACGSNSSTPTLTGKVISPLYNQGVTSTAIKNDLRAAFLTITPPAGPPAAGSLGGATAIPAGTTLGAPTGSALVQGDNLFVPGVYQSVTSILVTGDVTLDGQGDPNAAFIFQSSETIGTADGATSPGAHPRILLINGAKASNVFWQAGTSATLGTFSEWQGNILASASITMKTGATSCGRLLAGAFTAGAFVFDSNVVSVPGNVNAPAACQ